jgi:hypothetical protein
MNNETKQTTIPMKGDNFEFINMVKFDKPISYPLTDMECALISTVFSYSDMLHSDVLTDDSGCTYRLTKKAKEEIKSIFDLLVGIISRDERAVEKMDEFRYLHSLSKDIVEPRTTSGGDHVS